MRVELEQLKVALEHRTTIGIAVGMVMMQYDLSQDDAFAYLLRCSSVSNRKVYDIAVEMVATREPPRLPHASASEPLGQPRQ